jgi:hypothetical protein
MQVRRVEAEEQRVPWVYLRPPEDGPEAGVLFVREGVDEAEVARALAHVSGFVPEYEMELRTRWSSGRGGAHPT